MNRVEYRKMFEAEDRHWWYVSLHELIMRRVRRERERKGGLKVLDAGCGTGRLCELLEGLGDISGCDISETAVRFCHERGMRDIHLADLNEADIGKERFDVITSIDVLYHQGIKDDSRVMEKFYEALKPGGLLVLNLPAFEFLRGPHDVAVRTVRRYTRKGLVRMLEKKGFRVELASYRLGFLFLPVIFYRLLRILSTGDENGEEVASDMWMPNALINAFLLRLSVMENPFIEMSIVPFGTSVFATARRPA
jgi:SAM-dependent methyltransferase